MRRKVIPIPCEEVEVSEILPILTHPHMARLDRVAQLGGVQPGFPGAKHSRLEHAIGTYAKTRRRAERWADERLIDRKDVLPLAVAGLVHDIGHPALSHVLERRLELDHHENGLELLREMRDAFDDVACGYRRTLAFLDKEGGDPLGSAVTDRTLGTDKLDYLWRDAYHAGVDVGIDFRWVESRLLMTEKGLALDMMAVAGLRSLLAGYLAMYGDFYLRKSSRIAQEFLGRMFGIMVTQGEASAASPLRMTDDELYASFWRASPPDVRDMRERWKRLDLPKTAVVWRKDPSKERVAGKPIAVREAGSDTLEMLAGLAPEMTDRISDAVADAISSPRHLTLVVKPTALSRMMPRDVLLWDDGRTVSYSDTDPSFFRSLEAQAEDYQSLRVCVPAGIRARVSEAAEEILETILRELERDKVAG